MQEISWIIWKGQWSIMIDMKYARDQFRQYLSNYDETDSKIKLKEVHTFAVLDAADEICRGEGFEEEDHQLALLIALLHDIGRFEQLKKFHSFDDRQFNHADFGVKVLFEDGLIERFISDRRFDGIIRSAILYHSRFSLPEGLNGRELLHCRIIRDADKLDNFRVKDTERIETLFDTAEEEVAMEPVTPTILEAVRAHRCIFSPDRVTHMDCWVSYLAFIFDLNFRSSFRFIERNDYLNRSIDRIAYKNPDTKRDMEEIRRICNSYIREHVR